MSFDFSTLITDRTSADVELWQQLKSLGWSGMSSEQQAQWLAGMRGAYNYTDLNRVTQCMEYLDDLFSSLGYDTGYTPISDHEQNVGPLPVGYTELDYIESTGTQYIDTGFKPNQDTRVLLNLNILSPSGTYGIFGSRTDNQVASFSLWMLSPNTRSDYGNNQLSISINPSSITTIDKNKNVTSLNGTTYTQSAQTFSSNANLTLFAINDSSDGVDPRMVSARLYSCQIYDNEILIRNFVPCKNPSGVVGMYDTVNGQFYGSAGTGEFTGPPPPLPMGYTPLEYIQSTGAQYIDTGFKPDNQTRMIVDAKLDNTSCNFFGSRIAWNNNQFGIFWASNNPYCVQINNASYNGGTFEESTRHTIELTSTQFKLDGNLQATVPSSVFECQNPAYLFWMPSSTASEFAIGKVYSCQIYDNGTLVRSFTPCQNPSGVVGLYDTVNGQFYGSATSTAFTAGPVVPTPDPDPEPEPEPELDTLWDETDVPTATQLNQYLSNVQKLRDTIELGQAAPDVPSTASQLTFQQANDIETILGVVYEYLLSVQAVFMRSGMAWAVSGGPGFYFSN